MTLLLATACGSDDGAASPGPDSGITSLSSTMTMGAGSTADPDDTGVRLDIGGGGADFAAGDTSSEPCDDLDATIRDFQSTHPDFETYAGDVASLGLVLPTIGADRKPAFNPAYAGEPMITSADTFAQWYVDVDAVNMAFPIALQLTEESPGIFSFDSNAFFPLDGMGFGDEGNPHNYHFTTEVHTSFTYAGGEVFTFRGDDDLWMFVDDRLAIDLGGLHPAQEASVEMDSLGLEVGETYPMDIFHAERHTTESNFRIVTTIECFVTPPPPG